MIDERSRAALARLTENEKACLRRRLMPQTAKEMAIDLGISPHAVEKRLKMARTKLGLSSSLEAARLLALAEKAEHLVPSPPDLFPAPLPLQSESDAAPPRWAGFVITGALVMILPLILISAALQTASSPTPAAPAMRKATLDETGAFLADVFRTFDKDGSGFLEPREVSALEPRDVHRDATLPPPPETGARDRAAETKWMNKLDHDHDGKVSEREYVEYMTPWVLLSGVPADWKRGR